MAAREEVINDSKTIDEDLKQVLLIILQYREDNQKMKNEIKNLQDEIDEFTIKEQTLREVLL